MPRTAASSDTSPGTDRASLPVADAAGGPGDDGDFFSLFHSSLLLLDSPEVCDSIATLSLAALYERAQVRREAFSFISCKGFGHRLT